MEHIADDNTMNAERTGSKQRDHQFDTLKGIMIFCVVLGHLLPRLSRFGDVPAAKHLYYAINLFHMPVFIFIAGHFSRHAGKNGDYVKKAVASCLIPYLLFDGAYAILRTEQINGIFTLLTPEWTMWFLLSLFLWKIFVEAVVQFRWPLLLSILLSLFTGFTEAGYFLSISRTFSFFPYFIAGYLLSSEDIRWLRNRNKIIAFLAFLSAIAFSQVLAYRDIGIDVFQCAHPYVELGIREAFGMLLRLLTILMAFLCIFSLLALVPEEKNILSSLGRNSLWVFLFHSGTIVLLQRLQIVKPRGPGSVLQAFLLSILICAVFGNDRFAKPANKLLNYIQRIVLK